MGPIHIEFAGLNGMNIDGMNTMTVSTNLYVTNAAVTNMTDNDISYCFVPLNPSN